VHSVGAHAHRQGGARSIRHGERDFPAISRSAPGVTSPIATRYTVRNTTGAVRGSTRRCRRVERGAYRGARPTKCCSEGCGRRCVRSGFGGGSLVSGATGLLAGDVQETVIATMHAAAVRPDSANSETTVSSPNSADSSDGSLGSISSSFSATSPPPGRRTH
jgi:hypothetical protein